MIAEVILNNIKKVCPYVSGEKRSRKKKGEEPEKKVNLQITDEGVVAVKRTATSSRLAHPQEVFNHPANLFVAGFIGMPVMNFFDAELIREGDHFFVALDGHRVHLYEDKCARLRANKVQSQSITLGVRPEHTDLSDVGVAGKVDVSEMMGSSVHLHVTAEGRDVILIVPTVDMTNIPAMGDTIRFSFKGNVAHVFSKETDCNLEF